MDETQHTLSGTWHFSDASETRGAFLVHKKLHKEITIPESTTLLRKENAATIKKGCYFRKV